MDDNAAILTKLQEGQAKVAQELQTVQGGASQYNRQLFIMALHWLALRGYLGLPGASTGLQRASPTHGVPCAASVQAVACTTPHVTQVGMKECDASATLFLMLSSPST